MATPVELQLSVIDRPKGVPSILTISKVSPPEPCQPILLQIIPEQAKTSDFQSLFSPRRPLLKIHNAVYVGSREERVEYNRGKSREGSICRRDVGIFSLSR